MGQDTSYSTKQASRLGKIATAHVSAETRTASCAYFATVYHARYPCSMTIHRLFPTFVYSGPLQNRGAKEFNRQLLKECRQLRHDDAAGRRWSAKNYPGGYTSYGSVHWLQRISPTFKALQTKLERHGKGFAHACEWEPEESELEMTGVWR